MAPARNGVFLACIAAAAVSAVWIALNAAKPLHVDDTFFVYWARAISPLPGESPMPEVNWDRYDEPLLSQTSHYMPGWSIVLSWARHLVGERETLLHWLQWPFATMFLAGIFLLARSLGAPPWATFLLCAASPAFLLPSASLMADMPAMGPGILGLALWYSVPGFAGRIAAGILLAVGAQMKQSVLVLYPLLLLRPEGGITRRPQDWVVAVLSLGLAGYYPDVAPHDPERRSIAGHVAWIVQSSWSPVLFRAKASYLLATAGAVLLTPVATAFALGARRSPSPAGRIRAVLAGIVCIPVLARLGFWKKHLAPGMNLAGVPGTANDLWFYASIGLVLAWAWLALRPGKNSASPILRWWLLLAAAGFMAGARFPAARSLMPALPPLCMAFAADLARALTPRTARLGLALSAIASLWLGTSLARSDYAFAECGKLAAVRGAAVAEARKLPLMTTGSWGLRYYVEKAGGRHLGSATDPVARGAVFLCPSLTDRRPLPDALEKRSRRLDSFRCPASPRWPPFLPVRTVPPARTVSAFHGGHVWFPYAFSRAALEETAVLEMQPLRREFGSRKR